MDNFMKGRYGADNLTTVLGTAGMAVTLIGAIADWAWLKWLGLAVVVLALLRALSKNCEARRRENEAWLRWTAKLPWKQGSTARGGAGRSSSTGSKPRPSKEDLKRQAKTAKQMWKGRKTKAFLKCPTCGTTLAVPKGKGRLIVTCPKCHTRMETKS